MSASASQKIPSQVRFDVSVFEVVVIAVVLLVIDVVHFTHLFKVFFQFFINLIIVWVISVKPFIIAVYRSGK
jgi:hypothetical protein